MKDGPVVRGGGRSRETINQITKGGLDVIGLLSLDPIHDRILRMSTNPCNQCHLMGKGLLLSPTSLQ